MVITLRNPRGTHMWNFKIFKSYEGSPFCVKLFHENQEIWSVMKIDWVFSIYYSICIVHNTILGSQTF